MEGEKDPMEAGEWAVIVIGIVTFLLDYSLLGFAFYHRHYPPLKIKQIHLVGWSLVAGTIWWLGGNSSVRVFPQTGYPAFLKACALWGIWLQLSLGTLLWVSLEIFRFWRLYYIVKLLKNPNSWAFRASFLVIWAPALLFGILATALNANEETEINGRLQCKQHSGATYTAFALVFYYFIIFCFFVISLKNIKQKYVREYQETRNVVIVFTILFIGYSIIVLLKYHYEVWGRALCSIIMLTTLNSTLIGHLAIPVYHIIFDKEEYLKRFQAERKNVTGSLGDHSKEKTMTPVGSVAHLPVPP